MPNRVKKRQHPIARVRGNWLPEEDEKLRRCVSGWPSHINPPYRPYFRSAQSAARARGWNCFRQSGGDGVLYMLSTLKQRLLHPCGLPCCNCEDI